MPFDDDVHFVVYFVAIRQLERKALVKGAFLQGLNISLALICPTLATVGTFCVHVAAGKDLTTSQVCHKFSFMPCLALVVLFHFPTARVSLLCSPQLALTCFALHVRYHLSSSLLCSLALPFSSTFIPVNRNSVATSCNGQKVDLALICGTARKTVIYS